jgi:hypothetical protein
MAHRGVGWSKYGGSKLVPYWICTECAEYRRGTVRILYWIGAIAAAVVLISLLLAMG